MKSGGKFCLLVAVVLLGLGSAVARPADAVVAADGSGDYTSIEQAIYGAPYRTAQDPRWVIRVKPGVYRERVYVQRERGRTALVGDDAATTILEAGIHASMTTPDGARLGTFRTATLHIDGDGFVVENLTIANTAGPVGQALAVRIDGDEVVFRGCRLLGWQDTLLVNRGRHYFENCTIEGDVDFIFGGATAWFAHCHLHALRDGYVTAASTPAGQAHGLIFSGGKVTGAEGVRTYLGRPWRDFASTVFMGVELGEAVRAEGWHNWNKPHAEATIRYAEHANTGPGATPAKRPDWVKQLSVEEAGRLTPEAVLGPGGWWRR
jgi:pectinesterase